MQLLNIALLIAGLFFCIGCRSSGHYCKDYDNKKQVNAELAELLLDVVNYTIKEFGGSSIPPFVFCEPYLDSFAIILQRRINGKDNAETIATEIRELLFEEAGFVFDDNQEDISTMLPQTVILLRKGSCLGLSLVMLMICEKAKIKMSGVLAPRHFFVRVKDSVSALNIESMKCGQSFPDFWYRQKYNIHDSASCYLRSLSTTEVVAAFRYNVGNMHLKKGDYIKAICQYKLATADFQDFAEAYGNLGIAYEAVSKSKEALVQLKKAKALYMREPKLFYNIGIVMLKQKKYIDAKDEFLQGLRLYPNDPDLLCGMGLVFFYEKRFADAHRILEQAIALSKDVSDACKLANRIINEQQTYNFSN